MMEHESNESRVTITLSKRWVHLLSHEDKRWTSMKIPIESRKCIDNTLESDRFVHKRIPIRVISCRVHTFERKLSLGCNYSILLHLPSTFSCLSRWGIIRTAWIEDTIENRCVLSPWFHWKVSCFGMNSSWTFPLKRIVLSDHLSKVTNSCLDSRNSQQVNLCLLNHVSIIPIISSSSQVIYLK
jgi:hypothetical protein